MKPKDTVTEVKSYISFRACCNTKSDASILPLSDRSSRFFASGCSVKTGKKKKNTPALSLVKLDPFGFRFPLYGVTQRSFDIRVCKSLISLMLSGNMLSDLRLRFHTCLRSLDLELLQ